MSLDSSFKTVKTQIFATSAEAFQAVSAYAATGGYTNVKDVVNDGDGIRYTAKTKNGRSGRNVAFGELRHRR